MTESDSFNVVCTGEIAEGFDLAQVQQSFSELFNLSPEKANAFLGSKRTVKKDLPQAKALAYKNKLESIGVVTVLEKINTEPAFAGLALEPMAESEAKEESKSFENAPEVPAEKYIAGEFRKPASAAATKVYVEDENAYEDVHDKLNIVAIGAAAVAAVVGALLWMFIVTIFGYELGIVAWGIGGLVGYAALAMGSRGQLCGIVCGALALLAILGGKYLAVGSIQDDVLEMFEESFATEEFNDISEEQQEIAAYYVANVHSEDELRVFIVENGYSEYYEAEEVTQEEIDDFKAYVAPMLEGMADGEFDMAAWVRESYEREMEGISKWELYQSSFGGVDLIFLFLGVGTAFKLGSGGKEQA